MRVAVFGVVLAAYLFVPWARWSPATGFELKSPRVRSGDEPHYLLIVNSLLQEHDLLLGDDYRRVRAGGAEAGLDLRGDELDHHTILVDASGHALWQRVYDWRTHLAQGGFARLQPGFDHAVEAPAHPPAFPALVALVLLPLRLSPGALEPWAISVVALLSFASLIALYAAARRAGFSEREGLVAVLLAGIGSPLLPYARSFFSEPAIGLALSLALWARLSGRPRLCGALCFAAAAFKPPFGLAAVGWALTGDRSQGKQLIETFAALCAGLLLFNLGLAHTAVISGTAGFEPAIGPSDLGMLFFSNNHGLLAFAPWAAAGLFVAARAAVRGEPGPLRELSWGAAPVLLVFAVAQVEAGGFCYGPRYLVPFLPWLALATVAAWREAGARWRAVIAALAIAGAAIAIPGAVRYRDLFDRPSAAAFWR